MCAVLPPKGNLETNIRNYLNCSYHLGYDLDSYFTKKNQIIMFGRLLSCYANFKQEWENGIYSIPQDPAHTMHLSPYIKKQSALKKLSRKINNYTYNEKLTEGAKNLLQDYMRTYSQGYMQDENKNIDSKIKEMFCGIFKQISDRKESYVTKATKELPDEVAKEITGYLAGGTKIKVKTKKTRMKTRKNRKYLQKSKNQKNK